MKLNTEKLPYIYDSLKENNIDAWLIVGRETQMRSEPVLPVLGDMAFIIATSIIFTKEKCIAVVSPLDYQGFKLIEGIDEVIEYKGTMEETLADVLKDISPKKLALNYNSGDAASDGLTFGYYLLLQEVFKNIDFKGEIVSAFPIISKVRGIKTASQIEKIQVCVDKTQEYLNSVPEICYEDTTSLDIFEYLHKIAYDEGFGMSWADSQCPGVMVDPNVPAGHSGIIETPLVKGCVINIDYGLKKDGYVSDIQRMYYVLKDDETDAPEEVKRAFYTVRDAILAAKEFIKPGVTGFQVDQVARHLVVDMGYDSWNAALGHQIGHECHDGGTILANRRARYNHTHLIDTPLDKGNVFTLEPGISIPQGRVGIEEDVVITETGCEFLSVPQQELMLIRLKKRV